MYRNKDRRGRQIGVYIDATTLNLVDKSSKALTMNRSEFIRHCIYHVLDESNALRTALKRGISEQDGYNPKLMEE
jgi:metal-responsive CopG/Arc/MetJ family transcriptional regulator